MGGPTWHRSLIAGKRNVVFRSEIHTVVWWSTWPRNLTVRDPFSMAYRGGWPWQRSRKVIRRVKNMKKAAAVTIAIGGLALAGAGAASANSAEGKAEQSPGVASGNVVQVPVGVNLNACGNTVSVVGVLNPASGNLCANK